MAKNPTTVLFVSISVMLLAFAIFGYVFLTSTLSQIQQSAQKDSDAIQNIIKDTTGHNLNLTIHNKEMLENTNLIVHKLYNLLSNETE